MNKIIRKNIICSIINKEIDNTNSLTDLNELLEALKKRIGDLSKKLPKLYDAIILFSFKFFSDDNGIINLDSQTIYKDIGNRIWMKNEGKEPIHYCTMEQWCNVADKLVEKFNLDINKFIEKINSRCVINFDTINKEDYIINLTNNKEL